MPVKTEIQNHYLPSLTRLAISSIIIYELSFFFTFWNGLNIYQWLYIPIYLLLAGCFFLGNFARQSAFVFGLSILAFRFSAERNGPFYFVQYHHTTLLGLICLILSISPSGAFLSVDRLKGRAEFQPYPQAVFLMRALISSVYFYAAIDKISWLEQNHLFSLFVRYVWGSINVPTWGSQTALLLTCVIIALEFTLAFAAWSARWTQKLLPVIVLFHVCAGIILPVSTFSFIIWIAWIWALPVETLDRFFSFQKLS